MTQGSCDSWLVGSRGPSWLVALRVGGGRYETLATIHQQTSPCLWTLDWSPLILEFFSECLLCVQPCTPWHDVELDSLGLLLSGREQTPEFTVIHT